MAEVRVVPFEEVRSCPALRLDAKHYIPIHRTWECKYGSSLRSKGKLVKAWLDGKITTEDFLLAMKYVK